MRTHFYFIILSFLCLFTSISVPAQTEPGGLYVSGRITTEQGNVGGSIIKMLRNGQPMIDYQVDNTGRFNLRFEFNNEYILIFQRPENFPQKYVISTIVPNAVLQRDRIFPPYPLDVNLFTEIPGINRGFADNTVLRIYYSAEVDNFIPEVYYNNAQIKRLIEVAVLQSQSVSREADMLKRLSNAELAALRKEYDEILRQAGADFDKGEYLAALDEYKAASRIFPSEQYPKDRIAEINDLIAVLGLQDELNRQQTEKYNQFIQTADRQFTARQYPQSKENYQQALIIRPADEYATKRIAEIEGIEVQMHTQNRYNDVIALADKAFDEKLWDESKKRYQEALQIRPGEAYPTTQISRIDQELQQLAQLAEKQSTFESAVLNGDASYARQFYPKALEYYRTALSIKPDDATVLAKIAKVEKEQKEINDRLYYDETIKAADKANKDQDYENARTLYASALTARPDQTYPQNQINAIDKITGDNQRYADLIARADASLAAQDYTSSREDYKAALEMKPREKYPADKIREIDGVLAGLAREDQQYRQLLAGADRFYNARQYPQAKGEYQKALGIRPDDPYPTEMLQKITDWEAEQVRLAEAQRQEEENRLVAEQQAKDRQYQTLIDEADRLASANELVNAVSKFRDALEVKPQEQYPIQRIEEIRGMIARQTEAQKNYETAIASADEAFRRERYPEARTAYQQALAVKPTESYPTDQIARIDSIEAEQARILAEKQAAEEAVRMAELAEQARLEAEQKAAEEASRLAALAELDRQYATAIAAGDAQFNQQQYPAAIAEYRKASQVMPDESYPKERMEEAERLQTAMVAAQRAYDTAIAAADRAFQRQAYPEARTGYQQAKEAKPSESYPTDQIARIDAIEAEQARQLAERQAAEEAARLAALAEQDRQYATAIAAGDAQFNQQQYPAAIAEYRKASQVKPDESYPKERMAEAERLQTAMVAAQRAYDTSIAAADRAFQRQAYPEARTGYQQAKEAKPSESYPTDQIARIDSIEAEQARQLAERQAAEEAARLAALAEQDRQYATAIAAGDAQFNQQQYPAAIAEYRKASQVKPDETYPKERMAEAERLQTAMVAAQRAYDTAISAADRAFQRQAYPEARTGYQQAKEAKPSESYPTNQIARIDSIEAEQARQLAAKQAAEEAARLAALAEQDRQYATAIAAGDAQFNQQQYPAAITEYRKASQVKPDETYPKERMAEAERLQTAMVAAQRAYDTAIAAADRAFQRQTYPEARTGYQQAKEAKPSESYPTDQIARIDSIEAEQARQLAEKQAAEESARQEQARLLAERQAAEEAARLAAIAEKDRQYANAIEAGDSFYNQQDFAKAITEYRKASTVKPDETYPKERIAASEQGLAQLAEQEGRNRDYLRFIGIADRAFGDQNFSSATTNYQQALNLKPEETYPQQKLAEITQILAQREIDEKYRQLLAAADGFFRSSSWEQARTGYGQALEVKPDEAYPKSQIAKIDENLQRLAQLAQQQAAQQAAPPAAAATPSSTTASADPGRSVSDELEALYQSYITVADETFTAQQYNVSRAWYYKALDVKPSETYPVGRIAEINRLLSQMVMSERDREFQQYINQGDDAFNNDQLAVARGWYNRALTIRANDAHALSQIREIQQTIDSRLQGGADKVFKDYMAEGDKAFEQKNYSVARVWYSRAHQLKPAETLPGEKLDEIRKLLN